MTSQMHSGRPCCKLDHWCHVWDSNPEIWEMTVMHAPTSKYHWTSTPHFYYKHITLKQKNHDDIQFYQALHNKFQQNLFTNSEVVSCWQMNMLNIKHAACIFIKCNIFTYKMLRVTQQPNIGHRHSSPWHKMYLCQKADIFYTVGPVHSVQYISHASSHCTVWLVSGSLVTSWFLT